jgi:hypothetical protein
MALELSGAIRSPRGTHGGQRWARGRARKDGADLYNWVRGGGEGFLAHQGNAVVVGSRYGRGTAGSGRRRATAVGQWRRAGSAVWPVCRHRVARPWTHRHRTQGLGSAALKLLDAGRPRRACTAGTTACRRGRARAARRRRTRRSGCFPIRLSTLWPNFTQIFATEMPQIIYTKVVDLLTLYNFYISRIGF